MSEKKYELNEKEQEQVSGGDDIESKDCYTTDPGGFYAATRGCEGCSLFLSCMNPTKKIFF